MRPLRSVALVVVLAVLVAVACAETTTIVQDLPPVVVDEDGIHEFPTPEPAIAPVYPITPPAPTKTPKPS